MQQRDPRAAIRIVFDGRDFRRNPDLVALEIDLAVALLMPAARNRDEIRPVLFRPPVARSPLPGSFRASAW